MNSFIRILAKAVNLPNIYMPKYSAGKQPLYTQRFTCMNLLLVRSFLILLFYPFTIFAQKETGDFFGNIANIQAQRLKLLEEKKPPILTEKYLSFQSGNANSFKAKKEISTKAELNKEIEKLREKFLPFMQELAPAISHYRSRIALNEFQWREETEEDKNNFIETLQGKGKWETVSVPHFGAPIGRATTFYYKKITVTKEQLEGKALFACFKAVDYKANVFLNGSYIGSHEGFFAPFEFNISKFAKPGENDLLIKVENDFTTTGFVAAGKPRVFGDKIYAVTGVGYDNFTDGGHQCAAGMGIYQDCFIESRSPIFISDVFVRPLFNEGAAEIRLTVNNYYEQELPVSFNLSLFGQNFEATIIKDSLIIPEILHVPGIGDLKKPTDWEKNKVNLGYGTNYFTWKIKIPDFRPWTNETPWLYQAQVQAINNKNQVIDSYKQSFGMRSFHMDTLSFPKGALYFNNEKIRLRGANDMGFMQQDVFKKDWKQLIDDILLAKACNMNFIRLTQRPEQPEVYEFADKLGMMLQTDFPTFGGIRYNMWEECVRQVAEMERLIRNHPSNIIITYINERFPNGEGHPHRNMSEPEQYFSLFRAMDESVLKENPDRVIKPGDGDYDPPTPGLPDNHCYNTWYNGQGLELGKLIKGYWQWVKPGWYYGCGEFGAEALDPLEVMNKYYPKEWLPKDKVDDKNWTANRIYAAQTHKFHYMWYPTQHSLKDWIEASQDHQAWAIKTVTQAFRRDSNMVTQALHLFIDAWPAGWMKTIMDVDRTPKKGFFAYRDALKPTIVSLRADRQQYFNGEKTKIEAWICNDLNSIPENTQLNYQFEKDGKVIVSGKQLANVPVNSALFQGYFSFSVPMVKQRTTYQLRAALIDAKGNSIDQTVMEIEVFPKDAFTNKTKLSFVDESSPVNDYMEKNLNFMQEKNWQSADVIWVANFNTYLKNQNELDQLASSGKRVILYQVPVGKHQIGNTNVLVQNTSMGSYFFANPETGHRFMKQSKPFDFRLWYDEKAGYITPFLDKIVLAESWKPILSTGNTNWVEDHGSAMAAGELSIGKGQIIICQLDLENKIQTNPVANNFLQQLISK